MYIHRLTEIDLQQGMKSASGKRINSHELHPSLANDGTDLLKERGEIVEVRGHRTTTKLDILRQRAYREIYDHTPVRENEGIETSLSVT